MMSGNVIQNWIRFLLIRKFNWWNIAEERDITMESLLGVQKTWKADIDDNGNLKVFRPDGQFFEIDLITAGYDRPIIVNYGIGKIAAILMAGGKLAVEPEVVVTSVDGVQKMEQDRVLRASQDNPNYSSLPQADIQTGANFLDSQRIIYRDGLTQSHVMAATDVPMRKVKDKDAPGGSKFVPCKMITLKDLGKTADGPGKISIFDAMSMLLDEDELTQIVDLMIKRISEMPA